MQKLVLIAALALSGCAASRAVAPIGKGNHGVTVDLGGPFVEYGSTPIPVPFASVGYRYGIDEHTDVHTALHLTGIPMFGMGGVDVGVGRELLTAKGARPRIMLDLTSYFFFGDAHGGAPKGGLQWFPDLSLAATWDLPHAEGRRPHRIYLGFDDFFQVAPSFHWIFTPFVGTELRAHDKLGIQLEVQWNQPWQDTTYANPVWIGPSHLGAVGVRLGFDVYLPGKKKVCAKPPQPAEPAQDAPPVQEVAP